ncbi:MAG: sensor histidine kinase [Gammaproteobacteria bacterium]
MTASPRARLLIVDDEAAQMNALRKTLEMEGYATRGFTSAEQALAALAEQPFDLMLTDLMMPEMDGIALLEAARRRDPHLAGVVMTGHGTIDTAVKAMRTGALDYIQKPFSLNVVLPVLGRALAMRRLQIENEELLQRVQERTHELEAANKELEAFSYSVSHDLRAPLRAVRGYCQMFSEDYGAAMPEEGRRLVQKALAGADRMGLLIDDLLMLSRYGRQPIVRRTVDIEALARRVVDELAAKEKEHRARVVIGALPSCSGDASLLEQVFINLLSNAFKFTRRRADARIEIDAKEHGDDEPIYFVRDNGAGFDMKYADKLFGAFQRLHSAEEFEGTGIGLSIVQRIVHRHGGRIWAESRPDEGATFYFTVASREAR